MSSNKVTKHTKGPWGSTMGTTKDYYIATKVESESGLIVAEVHGFGDSSQKAEEQALANAVLIAAAPEMLKALQACLVFEDALVSDGRMRAMALVRIALTKAGVSNE